MQTDAASEAGEISRPPSRSATTARRISCMPPPAPPSAARGGPPQREPPTPQGNPGDFGAKRIAVHQAAVPTFDITQHFQVCLGSGHPAIHVGRLFDLKTVGRDTTSGVDLKPHKTSYLDVGIAKKVLERISALHSTRG